MEFRILGPLDVVAEARPLELGRRKQRAVLAILLVHANGVVGLDQLVAELWGRSRQLRRSAPCRPTSRTCDGCWNRAVQPALRPGCC